jgi:superfamily II DNA or RNA helicase
MPPSTQDVFGYDPADAARPPWPHQKELIDALRSHNEEHRPGSRQRVCVATGGGKRRIFNDFAFLHALPEGWRVLVVTKDWYLLHQAAKDLCARHPGARDRIGFVGPSGRRWFPGITESAEKDIVFTTIQTWAARASTTFSDCEFQVVIIDEYHWGEGGELYEQLEGRYHLMAAIVGVTATPRVWTEYELVGRRFDFADLVEVGVLARPFVFPMPTTGIAWSAETCSEAGDFTATSLSELAQSPERNALIVGTYTAHREAFGKTIVFACNIDHAKLLARAFRRAGVRAVALHSDLKMPKRHDHLRRFTAGTVEVLVNVAMATHGVDVPDIRTVFLARPTRSDILFAQMVGRGSRIAPGKTFFTVVDFVDDIPVLGLPPVRPDGFFGSTLVRRSAPLEHHGFRDEGFLSIPVLAGYEELAGLEYNPGQTFGIEFELDGVRCDRARFLQVATRLLDSLRAAVPTATEMVPYHRAPKSNAVWNVEEDPSCGWEITSRILIGEQGFLEVADACRVIQSVAEAEGLRVSVRTGTHVHLGWNPGGMALRALFDLVAYYEPAVLSLVGPSRASSTFAKSVRKSARSLLNLGDHSAWAREFAPISSRYLGVNPRNLFGSRYGTLEVRWHSGTIEAAKILTWVSLWMRIVSAGSQIVGPPGISTARVPTSPLCTGPRGDIRHLGRHVGAGEPLIERLVARRGHVVSRWWQADPRYAALARRLLDRWNAGGTQERTDVSEAV